MGQCGVGSTHLLLRLAAVVAPSSGRYTGHCDAQLSGIDVTERTTSGRAH